MLCRQILYEDWVNSPPGLAVQKYNERTWDREGVEMAMINIVLQGLFATRERKLNAVFIVDFLLAILNIYNYSKQGGLSVDDFLSSLYRRSNFEAES